MEVNGLNTCNAKHLGLRVTRILNMKCSYRDVLEGEGSGQSEAAHALTD